MLVKYLSPTSLHTWESDRERFFFRYLADKRQYDDQTDAMSVGSSFDAYVKADLYKKLFGGGNPVYKFNTLFETQVDSHVRDFALKAGKEVFDAYVYSGAYGVLLQELMEAREAPEFEFTLRQEVCGVPLMGKPDCKYVREDGLVVVLDWKVNGYCGKRATSPAKYYSIARDGWGAEIGPPSRTVSKAHPKYVEIDCQGMKIGNHCLSNTDKKWADQLAIYSWMMGIKVGDDNVVTCIDQLVTKPTPAGRMIRIASHRCRISKEWQVMLLDRLTKAWTAINEGHIFPYLSVEESQDRCDILNMRSTSNRADFWDNLNERKISW